MRAHDAGYDVFLGNFRGAADMGHVKEGLSAREYWNYSVNEHGALVQCE